MSPPIRPELHLMHPIAVIGLTLDGVIRLWSTGAEMLYGCTADEAVGRLAAEVPDLGLSPEQIAELLLAGEVGLWLNEHEVITRTGRRVMLRTTASILRGPAGYEEVIACSIPSATVDQPGQEPGTPSLRRLLELGSELPVVCDRQMTVVYVGSSIGRLYGFAARELIGSSALHYFHPDDRAALVDNWAASLAMPYRQRAVEVRILDAGGAAHWVEARMTDLSDAPDVQGVVLSIRDISSARAELEELRRRCSLLERIVDVVTDGVWVVDRNAATVMANPRMAELLALDPSRLIGGHPWEFLGKDAGQNVLDHVGKRKHGVCEEYDISFVRADGQRRGLRIRALPWYDLDAEHRGSIAICQDLPADARESAPAAAKGHDGIAGWDRLTVREREVVDRIAVGDRAPVIARNLFITQSTVRNHLSSAFRKLCVRSQQELIELLRDCEG